MITTNPESLLEKANILTEEKRIPVIPIRRSGNDKKRPALQTWTDRRDREQLATQEERQDWFANSMYNLGMILGKQDVGIDIDGPESKRIFWDVLLPMCSNESTKYKISNTWRIMTPGGGEHLTLKTVSENGNDDKKASNRKWGVIENIDNSWKHDMLESLTYPKYMIIAGFEDEAKKYQDITDMNIQNLEKGERENLFDLLQKFKVLVDSTINIAKLLIDFYHTNYRNDICWTLAGFLFKYGSPLWFISETIRRVAMYNKDTDPIESRLDTVKYTCEKDPNSKELSGYEKFLEVLINAYNGKDDNEKAAKLTITKISGIMDEAAQIFGFEWLRGFNYSDIQENIDYYKTVIDRLPDNIKSQLEHHIYYVLKRNPLTFVIADKFTKQITKVVIRKKSKHVRNKDAKITTEITTEYLSYEPTDVIIDAIPLKVIIYRHPMKGSETYKVTFQSASCDKPFTIGPTTIDIMIEELQNRRKIVKRLEAPEYLALIITAYEKASLAETLDETIEPGYYWIDGKIVGFGINQRLDLDPQNNEQDRREVLECIEVLEGLQERSKKKAAFPTALKWSVLAPFSFITKTSKNMDDWLPWLYLYDTTDTGKTTLIIITALAIWGKHDKEQDYIHFRGPGNIDSPSKLGITVSKTTYPVLVDEVGGLLSDDNKHNNNLLDMVKYSVQSKSIRSVYGEDVLALSPLALTANDPPPQNEAYRRRFVAIQYYESEKWMEKEKEAFKRWLDEGNRKNKLKTLGDFVACYVVKHPEIVLKYSSYLWYERGAIILKEFYRSVDREPPEWIDLHAEQTIVQEVSEEKQFEIRGFLQQVILEAYRRESFINPDPSTIDNQGRRIYDMQITLEQKINHCLDNKFIPFLHLCKRNLGQEIEVAITSDIHLEFKRYDKSAATMTMNTWACKIPGFKCDLRNVGGKRTRVICGPKSNFLEFLNCEVEN